LDWHKVLFQSYINIKYRYWLVFLNRILYICIYIYIWYIYIIDIWLKILLNLKLSAWRSSSQTHDVVPMKIFPIQKIRMICVDFYTYDRNVCIYVYIHIYVCIYIYIYIYIYIWISICVMGMYVCIYIHTYISIFIYEHASSWWECMRSRLPFKNTTHCGNRVGVLKNGLLWEPDEEGMGALLQCLAVRCSELHCVALCCTVLLFDEECYFGGFWRRDRHRTPKTNCNPGRLLNHSTSGQENSLSFKDIYFCLNGI